MDLKKRVASHALGMLLLFVVAVFLLMPIMSTVSTEMPENCKKQVDAPTLDAENNMKLFNYVKYYHCAETPLFLKAPLLLLWFIMMINLLATTADCFLVPQLEAMSERLQLSEDVAGVTLLALGNGMPDVMTGYAALLGGEDGFGTMMGEMLGAANFIVGFILGVLILMQSQPSAVDGMPFIRDTMSYFVVVVLMVAVCWDNVITMVESLSFFLAYILYVCVVVLPSRLQKHRALKRLAPNMAAFASPSGRPWRNQVSDTVARLRGQPEQADRVEALLQQEARAEAGGAGNTLRAGPSAATRGVPSNVQMFSMDAGDGNLEVEEPDGDFIQLDSDTEEVLEDKDSALEGFTEPQHILDGILLTMEWPFSAARHLSIPAAHWNGRRRILAALSPVFGMLVNLLSFSGPDFFEKSCLEVGDLLVPAWCLLVMGAWLVSALILNFSTPDQLPQWHSLLLVFAFVTTIAWFKMVANECVALLNIMGLKLGLSASLLAATVLAWGNCVGDLVADTSLVRKGKAKMAISGCFGSPLLSDLLGLGVAFTAWQLANSSSEKEGLEVKFDQQLKVAAAFAVISLVTTVSGFVAFKFTCPRWLGWVLLAEYGILTVVSIVTELV